MTRRRFLAWIAAAGTLALAAMYVLKSWSRLSPRILNYLRPRLDIDSPKGRLSENEMKNIVALGEVLIPGDETPGADEIYVRDYVNHKTENEPGYLVEYRNAATLLNRMSQAFAGNDRKFWELPGSTRDRILRRNFRMDTFFEKVLFRLHALTAWGKSKLHFRDFVLRELIYDFYSSPRGWLVVGYTNYPGVPGNPREYTEALGPVQAMAG